MAKLQLMEKIISISRRISLVFILLYVVTVGILVYTGIELNYRTPLYIVYAIVFFFFCMSLAVIVRKIKLFEIIGKDSFAIYLLHMPFAGIAVYVGNAYLPNWGFELCRPFIVFIVVELLIILYRFIANKLPDKPSRIMKTCIGLR